MPAQAEQDYRPGEHVMRRWIVLLTTLTVSLFAFSQAVVTSAGTATIQGAAVAQAPFSPPLVVTPTITLGTPPLQIGATNATPGTYAGANNAPPPIAATPSLPQVIPQISTTVPVIHEVGPQIFVGNPANLPMSGSPVVSAPGEAVMFDMGISDGSVSPSGVGNTDLAQVAASSRRRENAQAGHLYTNQDIARINQQTGTGGLTGAAVNAGTSENNGAITPAPGEAAVGANTGATQPAPPAAAEPQKPSPYVNSPFQPKLPTTQTPPAPTTPHEQAATPPETQEMAQATPPAQPSAEQAQEAQSAPAPTNKAKQLPRAASVLPLLAVLGMAAAATGVLTRK